MRWALVLHQSRRAALLASDRQIARLLLLDLMGLSDTSSSRPYLPALLQLKPFARSNVDGVPGELKQLVVNISAVIL